jgi:hypothetical protein
MMRDIERRLKKLESQVPPRLTKLQRLWLIRERFLTYAVAYYLGYQSPEESIVEAHMRALGYTNSYEDREAYNAFGPDYRERERLARIKLFTKFGVTEEDHPDKVMKAYRQMGDGFPEHYVSCLSGPIGDLA